MSFFVSRDEVPVTLDDESVPFEERNIIFIKPKMDFGTKQIVQDAVRKMTTTGDGQMLTEIEIGAGNTALLHHNVVRWQGPGFQAMPCTPENIDRLDPDLPLLERVLEEINARNAPKEKDDPNSQTKSTSESKSGSHKSGLRAVR